MPLWRRGLDALPLGLGLAALLCLISTVEHLWSGWPAYGEGLAFLVLAGLALVLRKRQPVLFSASQHFSRAFDALAASHPTPELGAELRALVEQSAALRRGSYSFYGFAVLGAAPCFGCIVFSFSPFPQTPADFLLPVLFWLPMLGMLCVLPFMIGGLQASAAAHLLRFAERRGAGDMTDLSQPLPSDVELPRRTRWVRGAAWLTGAGWLVAMGGSLILGVAGLSRGMAVSMLGWTGATAAGELLLALFCVCSARLAAAAADGVAGLHGLLDEIDKADRGEASYQPLKALVRLRKARRFFHIQTLAGAALALSSAAVMGFPRFLGMPFGFIWWLASFRPVFVLLGLALWLPALDRVLQPGLDGLEYCLQTWQERLWKAEQSGPGAEQG